MQHFYLFVLFLLPDIFLKVQLYSKRKKRAIPQSSKTAVEQKTSFECTESVLILNFLSLRSCQTIKPIPPKTIRAEIVKIITGSLLTVVSEDDGENIPALFVNVFRKRLSLKYRILLKESIGSLHLSNVRVLVKTVTNY